MATPSFVDFATIAPSALPKVRVLVAIDDPAEREAVISLVAAIKPRWLTSSVIGSVRDLAQHVLLGNPDAFVISGRLGGEDTLKALRDVSNLPVVVVAACPQQAICAFEHAAVDCVASPLEPARMRAALDRLEIALEPQTPGDGLSLGRLCFLQGRHLSFCELSEVYYFQAQRKYTRVVLADTEGLLRTGISQLESILTGKGFWRVHRGVLTNMRQVKAARRDELGRLTLELNGRRETLLVSRPNEVRFRDGLL